MKKKSSKYQSMSTTFENNEMQELDPEELDRQLKEDGVISDVDLYSNDGHLACLADDLAGQPLSKSIPCSDASVNSIKPRRLPKGSIAFLFVVLLIVVTLLCALLVSDTISSSEAGMNAKDLRFKRFFSLILDFEVTKRENLENDKTPQARALQWLAYEDDTEDVEDLRIRYSLATLYFSTLSNTTSSWRNKTNWLTNSSVCHWYGVTCLETQANVHLVQSLNLSTNGLEGTIPDEVGLLQNDCEELDLSYNSIRGSIPSTIGDRMHNLKRLYLGPNRLKSTIPENIYDLRFLSHLYIDSSNLSGTLSKRIGKLTNLQGLGLHENHLTGVLPDTLGLLSHLRVLNLDNNTLKGPIPTLLGALTKLIDLRLDHNDFTGSVPRSFANLSLLEILYLDNNRLVGPIPNVVAENLPLLTELHLHNNGFTGAVPNGLAKAPFLEVLYLDGNNFGGSMPEAICNRRTNRGNGGVLKDLWADCAYPSRKVDCHEDCCTRCVK
jgi:hypothetical protein